MKRSLLLLTLAGCGLPPPMPVDAGPPLPTPQLDAGDPCAIIAVTDLGDQGNVNMMDLSPDHTQVVVNKKDGNGVFQVFIGPDQQHLTCISCDPVPSGPSPSKNKVMTLFTRFPGWITLGVEMDAPNWPAVICDQKCKDGLLISGINADLWAMKTDGSQWVQLVKWDPMHPDQGQGYTGPAFTPDGKHGYWAEIVDGNIFAYGFGKWRLIRSDFALDENGTLTMNNNTDLTPTGANWVEPGNITPDGKKLLLSSDVGLPASNPFGQDQFLLDLETGVLTNLTGSPTAWDEHGLFSPDGKKIVWMSSKPYPDATWVGNLRTDFMLMNADGSNVQQLTHFNQPGYPESRDGGSVAAVAGFSPDGRRLFATDQWDVGTQRLFVFDFNGACGMQ